MVLQRLRVSTISEQCLDPLHDSVYIFIDVVYFLALQLHSDLFFVAFGDLGRQLTEDLALDVLRDLCVIIAAFLEAVVQVCVVASEQHHQLEPALREEVTAVELEDDAALLRHHGLQLVADHVLVELGHIKLIVPRLVQLLFADQIGELDVREALDLEFVRQPLLQLLAQRGLADARRTCDQNVRQNLIFFHF